MVTRFDPFRDFDRLAERMLSSAAEMGQTMRAVPMDVFRRGAEYVLQCDLPGADPGSVDVGIDGRVLTIRAQRSPRTEQTEWLTQERPTGAFVRQVTLGNDLDIERITASYQDGVLTLSLPVVEQAKPRRITVAQGGSAHEVTTRAQEGAREESATAGS